MYYTKSYIELDGDSYDSAHIWQKERFDEQMAALSFWDRPDWYREMENPCKGHPLHELVKRARSDFDPLEAEEIEPREIYELLLAGHSFDDCDDEGRTVWEYVDGCEGFTELFQKALRITARFVRRRQ